MTRRIFIRPINRSLVRTLIPRQRVILESTSSWWRPIEACVPRIGVDDGPSDSGAGRVESGPLNHDGYVIPRVTRSAHSESVMSFNVLYFEKVRIKIRYLSYECVLHS